MRVKHRRTVEEGGPLAEQLRHLVWCPCPLVTTLLLFGDSKTAASGLKHRGWTLTMKAAQRASPKGTSRECLGNFPPVCAEDILHWSGKACLRHHITRFSVLGISPLPVCNWPRISLWGWLTLPHRLQLPMVERSG